MADLDDNQAQLAAVFDASPVPMATFTPDGTILRTNAAYREWLDLPDVLPTGFTVRDLPLTPHGDPEPLFDVVLRSGGQISVTRQYRRDDDGSLIWVEVHSNALLDADGRPRMIFAHCLEVTNNYRHQRQLRDQIRHDELTGLLSRSGFEQDLSRLLDELPRPMSVLLLDVDRFKTINNGSGHHTGDEVLRQLAARIVAAAPPGALVARLGGDEFAIAVPGPSEQAQVTGRAMLAAFTEPVALHGRRIQLEASIGLATVAGSGQAGDALRSADTAMYVAKQTGGNRLEVFTEQMHQRVLERIVAEERLREALRGDLPETLPVWFQPVVSTTDRRLLGAEALVRLRTPEGAVLAPSQFIPAAEETGLVVALGEHVLREAMRWLGRWRDDLEYVSVNVSPRQLTEPDFVPMLVRLLAEHADLSPHRLVLEITETAMLATSVDMIERLHAIKATGVRIALDDFGTGYSSLTWLQSLPADIVKLDRSFVTGADHDRRKSSIISATLWLAGSLGMSVIAEGVEDTGDWELLTAAGVPAVQGYYISRPVPADEFRASVPAAARRPHLPAPR